LVNDLVYAAHRRPEAAQQLRDRIAAELTTTFVSKYNAKITLAEALSADRILPYAKHATGERYLPTPDQRLA